MGPTLLIVLGSGCRIPGDLDTAGDEAPLADTDTATVDSGDTSAEPADTGPADTDGADTDAADTDSGDTGGEPADTGLPIDVDVLTRLANRLVKVQNDDGSFGWQRHVDDPLDTTGEGYQNVTGITALGFFGALAHTSEPAWETALDATTVWLAARLDGLAADPYDTDNSLSCSNFTYLAEVLEREPDDDLGARAAAALSAKMDAQDETWGTDDDQRADGLANGIIEGRAYIPGIVPWDLALCVEGLRAMAPWDADLGQDADDLEAHLADLVQSELLPAYDDDPAYAYADISLALPLYVLTGDDAAGDHSALAAELLARLEALVDDEGRVTNGSDDDGPQQASAYALMAFKRTDSDQAETVQLYLEGQVGTDGVVWNEATGMETYEVEGEMLRALGLVE